MGENTCQVLVLRCSVFVSAQEGEEEPKVCHPGSLSFSLSTMVLPPICLPIRDLSDS